MRTRVSPAPFAAALLSLALLSGCSAPKGGDGSVLLQGSISDKAVWIGTESPEDVPSGHTKVPARYLRKEFGLAGKVSEARLTLSGLGLYEAYVNGRRIGGDQALSPTPSDYDKLVYTNSFDVTDLLRKGDNAVGVILGNGRYMSMRIPGVYHYDLPILLLQLDVLLKDGSSFTLVSDSSWKVSCGGPVRTNNEFDGEVYDARLEMPRWSEPGFDDSVWEAASVRKAPGGEVRPQENPNICVQDIVSPVSVTPREGGSYIVDMGQNLVGWFRIKASGLERGDSLRIVYAETLDPDGGLYLDNLRSAEVTDVYVAADGSDVDWCQKFVYHGYRYAEVSGLKNVPSTSDFEGLVLYDKMDVTGSFLCSDPVMNQVYRNAYWGIRGNYRGMPTDCPQRDERMGWAGDRTTGCYGEAYIFDNHALYKKWMTDFALAQRGDGSLPDVAPPFWHIYSDNMTWPGVLIHGCDMLYRQYGDAQPLVAHYPVMKKWLEYMKDRYMEDGILTKDTYGDWCLPPESLELIHSKDPARITAAGVISTAWYVHFMKMMEELAPVAGHPEDVAWYHSEAAASTEAFNAKYYDADNGCYDNNTVTANLLALWFGLVPEGGEEKVFANIVDKTENEWDGHISTGVIGTQMIMRTLTEYGRGDLAFRIASSDSYPSWGYMAANGATTIWELWNGNTADPSMNSGNHVMLLGDLVVWEYEYLAGIRALEPGFRKIGFRPYPVEGLDSVECSYESVRGRISSSWKKVDGEFKWDIEVPSGTTALVWIPGRGEPVEKGPGRHHITCEQPVYQFR